MTHKSTLLQSMPASASNIHIFQVCYMLKSTACNIIFLSQFSLKDVTMQNCTCTQTINYELVGISKIRNNAEQTKTYNF